MKKERNKNCFGNFLRWNPVFDQKNRRVDNFLLCNEFIAAILITNPGSNRLTICNLYNIHVSNTPQFHCLHKSKINIFNHSKNYVFYFSHIFSHPLLHSLSTSSNWFHDIYNTFTNIFQRKFNTYIRMYLHLCRLNRILPLKWYQRSCVWAGLGDDYINQRTVMSKVTRRMIMAGMTKFLNITYN